MAILVRPSSTVSCTGISRIMSRRPPVPAPPASGDSSWNTRAGAAVAALLWREAGSCSAMAAAQSSALRSFLSSAIAAALLIVPLADYLVDLECVAAVHHTVAALKDGNPVHLGADHVR